MVEARSSKADGLDFIATEYQDNFRDKFYYASDATELEEIVAGIQAGTLPPLNIKLAPVEFALTATMAIANKLMTGLTFIGDSGTVIKGPAAAKAILIKFAASHLTASFELNFKNLRIEGQSTFNALEIDNTNAGKKIIVGLDGSCCDAASGKGLEVVHGDADNGVRIYCTPGEQVDWDGEILFTGNNNGDRFRATGHNFEEHGFVSGTAATVAEFTFVACLLKAAGITGGASQQRVNIMGCYTMNSSTGVMTAAVDGDKAGSQTLVRG